MTCAPELKPADDDQLLAWCAGIVALARKNGYLTSTADSIAVYHTTTLLAQMRNRLLHHPATTTHRPHQTPVGVRLAVLADRRVP